MDGYVVIIAMLQNQSLDLSKQEATRAYQNLNPVERGVLILTRSILGNRPARAFFICYALALHVLVMFTIYECTNSSGTQLERQPYPHAS